MRVNRIALCASASVALALVACSAPSSTTPQSYGDPPNGGSAGAGGAGASGAIGGTGQGATGAAGGAGGAGAAAGTGASGGSAGAGGTGTGGAIGADAGPDARFDWPDTPPGAGECKAGRYVGTFECTYKDPAGTYMMPVTGPMSMTLTKSEQGEFLEVSDGVIDGSALIFVTFRAT